MKILAFAGSTRKDSYNKKLVKVAAQGAEAAGAQITYIDLEDYPLPFYDEDVERQEGMPENALKLKQIFTEHDGLLIASPEYNSSYSAVLKNTIDWVSRSQDKSEPPLSAFQGKYAVIMSASPGGLGGLRGLVSLRMLLGNIKITVLPDQIAVPAAHKAFEGNKLTDTKLESQILGLGEALAKI